MMLPLYRILEIDDERFAIVRSMDTANGSVVYAERELQLCGVWIARFAYERARGIPKIEAMRRATAHAETFALRAGTTAPGA